MKETKVNKHMWFSSFSEVEVAILNPETFQFVDGLKWDDVITDQGI